jgi:hypothetical protein
MDPLQFQACIRVSPIIAVNFMGLEKTWSDIIGLARGIASIPGATDRNIPGIIR